jgi:ketosteroid isomerase-like protein
VQRFARLFVLLLLLAPVYANAQPQNAAQDDVWAREVTYWKAVQANDLDTYRSLWRDDFLGWPFSSTNPARKAQITRWITAHTGKGDRLKSYSLERLTVQVSGDMATTTYRVHVTWAGKDGKENSEISRILHTWHRGGDGTWHIFSGMSAPAK